MVFVLTGWPCRADGPSWWTNRNVLANDPVVLTNDYAAVNMGQLKWIATNAYDEVASVFGTASVTNVAVLFTSWLPGVSNYTAVNVGQVKHVGALFYDSLIAAGYTAAYPWVGAPQTNDYTIANIGQVKQVFNFDLTSDADADGLANWKEDGLGVYVGPNRTGSSASDGDSDDDGIGDGTEVTNRTDPNNGDTTRPTVTIASPANGYIKRWIP
jgi:type II secretory pathway pseudopilin PulG